MVAETDIAHGSVKAVALATVPKEHPQVKHLEGWQMSGNTCVLDLDLNEPTFRHFHINCPQECFKMHRTLS